MSHTPEKWYVGYGHVFTVTGEDQVEIIAEHIRDEKTAHQIKAIPDMLEALEGAKWLIDCYVAKPERYEEYQDVVKAIRKARVIQKARR